MMSRTLIAWTPWQVPRNQLSRARMVHVTHAELRAPTAIVIVVGEVAVAAQVAAIVEATAAMVEATAAVVVADAEDAKTVPGIQLRVAKGRSDAALFFG